VRRPDVDSPMHNDRRNNGSRVKRPMTIVVVK
jgi:hypothetical protein